jgi:hypothetical protein
MNKIYACFFIALKTYNLILSHFYLLTSKSYPDIMYK